MPEWLISTAYTFPQSAGDTDYYTPLASLRGSGGEGLPQVRSRDSYTWANLFARVTGNTLVGATTVRSRINGGNGNQTVSIGAGATGTFTDAVNSDTLVGGSLFNWSVVAGAGTSIIFTVLASTLTTVANTTPIVAATDLGIAYWGPSDVGYFTYLGCIFRNALDANVQYRFRTAATLSNFRIYVADNELTAASTFRVRKNGANGNQSISVPGGGTGSYEDAVNTDGFVAGDLMNYQVVAGATGIDIGITVVQVKLDSQMRHIGCSGDVNLLYLGGAPRYNAIEGLMENLWTTTEAEQQANALAAFTLRNLYVRMTFNWHDGAIVIRTRKNGGDGNLVVSIAAGLTGEFEDLVNSDDFLAANSLNWKLVFGGSAGNCRPRYIGAELIQPAAGPAGPVGKSIADKMVAGSLI